MGILDRGHGLHLGIAEGEYHERILGVASKGALDKVRRSPAHYRSWVDGVAPEETSVALEFGKAFHCATLEPDVFERTYVVMPSFGDMRSSTNRTKRDAWLEEHPGVKVIAKEDHDTALRMSDAIRRHSRAGKLLVGGSTEVTARWKDAESGIECKARADFYDPARALIVDLKTTENADEAPTSRSFANYGYARQDAFYRRGFTAAGAPIRAFIFVCVEKVHPYGITVWTLDEADRKEALEDVRDDLGTLATCLEHDRWDSYPEEIRILRLPGWARRNGRAA